MKNFFLVLLALLFFPLTLNAGESPASIAVGHFSQAPQTAELPAHWQPLHFENISSHTIYSVVPHNGLSVIKAESTASSSGLTREITINPAEYPMLSWSWKVSNIYQGGDVRVKEGDDYPARIYITFAYDAEKVGFWESVKFNAIKLFYGKYPPINAINYIWANKAPKELITPNPYTDRVKMIVIESGENKIGSWIQEKRNIADDYRSAFGEEPPHISGIAIMSDSDNTGESAIAWYGDIIFSKQ